MAGECASWRRCVVGHSLTLLGVAALVAYLNWPSHLDAEADLAGMFGAGVPVSEAQAFVDPVGGRTIYYRFRAPEDEVQAFVGRLAVAKAAVASADPGEFWAADPPSWWRPEEVAGGIFFAGSDAQGRRYRVAVDRGSGLTYLVQVRP